MDNSNNGNGQNHGPQSPSPLRAGQHGVKGTVQAAFIQRFIFDALVALRQNCTQAETGRLTMDVKTAVQVHKLAGAWDTVTDRLRILRGRGLPASVRSKARQPASVEPLEPP
jgi:hypothetical protein